MKISRVFYITFAVMALTSCGSSKHASTSTAVPVSGATVGVTESKVSKDTIKTIPVAVQYLSSRIRMTLPQNMTGLTLNGKMKMKSDERVQMSIVMPILGNEIAKADITPNEVLFIDRMHKMYVKATRDELSKYLPKNSEFSQLVKLIVDASKPGGRSSLKGSELGLKSLKDAKVELYDFSSDELNLTPTAEPTKYKKVTVEEFIKAFKSLQ